MYLRIKLLYLLTSIIFTTITFAQEQSIKKITADNTEYNRKDKIIKFKQNVVIEFKDGKIFCNEAIFDENNKNILCKFNVYAIIISTKDNSMVEIWSNMAKYDSLGMVLEFTENPYVLYKNSDGKQHTHLYAEKILFKENNDKIICVGNVKIKNMQGELSCSYAEYYISNKIVYMNYFEQENSSEKVVFVSKQSSINVEYFTSNKAIFYIDKNKIYLDGKVEIVFKNEHNS